MAVGQHPEFVQRWGVDDGDVPWAGQTPKPFDESTGHSSKGKVGWTLRNGSNRVVAGFAWNINPQGLTRVESSRAQLYATKGGFYLNDFGPGPPKITLRQMVASGKARNDRFGVLEQEFSNRDDVKRFIKKIWIPATTNVGLRVFFHDNHLERGHQEHVYFPPDGLSIQRSIDMHNVWLVELQMVGLEAHALAGLHETHATDHITGRRRRYIVKASDTLHRLVVRIAGKHANRKRQKTILARILALNPKLKHKRTVTVDSGDSGGSKKVTVRPHQLVAGELIFLPA